MTPIISILVFTSALAIALATAALVLGRPDRQTRSDLEILREEISKLWDCLQGEIRRQSVRTSRASASQRAEPTSPSPDGSLLSDRSALLAEFERRRRTQ